MMIKILDIAIVDGPEGNPIHRSVDIIISNNSESYRYRIGGLPLEGDLQAILEVREAELFTLAQAAGEAVSDETTAQVSARDWYEAHPNAALLFTLSISDLEAEIDGWDLSTAQGQGRLKFLCKTLAVAVRVLARREKLI